MTGQSAEHRFSHIAAVDGLRAVAVCAIILHHLRPPLLPGGFTGIDLFFVISGFVITGSLLGHGMDGLRQAAHFYARRLIRIVPTLLLMLLATIVATRMFVPQPWPGEAVDEVARAAFFGFANIILAAGGGETPAQNPFTHSWALSVALQFYLAVPLLLYWHRRWLSWLDATRLIAILSGLSLLACGVLSRLAPEAGFYLVFSRFWELGAGMLLFLTADTWGPPLLAASWVRQQALGWIGAGLIAAGFAVPASALFPFPLALLPVLGTAALIASVCAAPRTPLARLLASTPLVAIGSLSYALYLWHWPVFVLFGWTWGLEGARPVLAALGLTIALALLSYLLVERPLRRSRWIARQAAPRVIAAVLALTAAAALGGDHLLGARDRLTLSVTRDAPVWRPDGAHPLDPSLSQCALGAARRGLALGEVTSWTAQGCSAPGDFRLFVAGDSHALSYTPALRQFAAEQGIEVRRYFRKDCPFLELRTTLASRPACQLYYAAVLADIGGSARPGDVIFLPGLRIRPLAEEPGADARRPSDRVPAEALAEARALLSKLAESGAAVLLEAPKPVFASPPFRCSDWFNRTNPVCAAGFTVPREALMERRRGLLRSMSALAAADPRINLWDPFPTLCPTDPCQAVPGDHPLFFDRDHLSGLGNDFVYPALRSAILSVRERSRSGTARSPVPAAP